VEGFLKLNFDRASKGNLGHAGAGGEIQYNTNKILRLYYSNMGALTNNAVKFLSLE